MKNLRIITTIFFLLTIFGCEKDLPVEPEAGELYAPYLISIRDNGEVTLKWGKPGCFYCGGCVCPQLNPDYFEILISDTDESSLNIHSTVSNNIFEVTINNLTNGTPYYFAIRAVGQEQVTVSKTIMTMPGNPETIQSLFPTIDDNQKHGTWSPDQSLAAYVSDYIWNNGSNSSKSLFIYSFSDHTEWLVEKNSYSPEWSPTIQKIVYHTDNGEINSGQGFPTHISLYNTVDSTVKRLTSGNTFNFLPTWSPDGNWIAFLSNKAGGSEYNIWKIPSDSGAAIQITSDFNNLNDLGILADRSPTALSWSKDMSSIAFARLTKAKHGYKSDIYTVPSNNGSKSILISSQWDDFAPAYSPDGTTIAFVSNRSGANEIWTMDLHTKKLKQVTGSTGKHIDDRKIEWSSSGNKILFTGGSNNILALYTVDTN